MQDKAKTLAIILRSGIHENLTLSSIRFKFFGEAREIPIIRCIDWQQGFEQALDQGFGLGLFVDSGTYFDDLDYFLLELDNYPHKGMVGHLVDPKDAEKAYWIHPQCFYLDLSLFKPDDFKIQNFYGPIPARSDRNVHHDYSPYWIRSSGKHRTYTGEHFGERLLARALEQGKPALNWIPKFRGYKTYLYTDEAVDIFLKSQQSYLDLAENQFWVFNNEALNLTPKGDRLVTPASGLFWMFNLDKVAAIDIVDISRTQIEFAQHLWESWDGINYGQITAEFIKNRGIEHLQLDNHSLDKLERIKLKKSSYLVEKINTIFNNQCIIHGVTDFQRLWQQGKTTKVSFNLGSILNYVKDYPHSDYDIWASNILDYKYSLLTHSAEDFAQFNQLLKEKNTNIR